MEQRDGTGPRPQAAVIGDVVGSRHSFARSDLQRHLRSALTRVNDLVPADQPLQITIGDEFQALYADLSHAVEATLWIRVQLVEHADVRLGIGWGELTFSNPDRIPYDQDGPCWWRAREAVDAIRAEAGAHGHSPARRTIVLSGSALDELLNAHLGLRDEVISRLDETDAAILDAMSRGETLTAIAERLQVNKSSVSRRARSHGLYTILEHRRPAIPEPAT